MYAVIATGGKQYKVAVGDEIFIEKLDGEQGDKVVFDQVLAIGDEDTMKLGKDLEGVTVSGEIVKNGKGKKIIIYKYKPKKGYRRKNGHRQPYTKVKISDIAV